MTKSVILDAMRRAILLSAHGLGSTSPNPPVGCVILDKNYSIVGEGYHVRKGEAHAEVHALRAAGAHARGGTAVVTLEPCNHVGRTPACHQALIDAQIASVVIALIDPTSRREGGAALLREAGIQVEVGILADEARLVIEPWLDALESGRPFTTWAYEVTDRGISSLAPGATLSDLRPQFDAVLDLAGGLQEGVPGSHGADVMKLPNLRPSYEPRDTLRALHAGGVRSLLLLGDLAAVEPFLNAQLIDRIEVQSTLTTGSSPRSAAWMGVPSGYRWSSFTRTEFGVRAHAVPYGHHLRQ